MRDKELDDILKQAGDAKQTVDPALLDRISRSIGSDLHPVQPMASLWILASGLVMICGTVALAAAMLLGPHGVQKMSGVEIGVIFPVLVVLMALSAAQCIAEAIPGSARPVSGWVLVVCGCIALAAMMGLLFHDYRTDQFFSQGVKCLAAGLVTAVPAAGANWLILRRGFSVNPAAAGIAGGMLAGLAGVTMLEIHCPNFEVPHLLAWHTAVIPVSALVGMLFALATKDRA